MADTELFSLGTWIAFYSIALIAGVTQGAFGFGYPAIATPTLVLFTDVKTAIVVNMVPNLCVNFLSILRGGNYRASLLPHWPVAVYTLIASFLGALFLIVAPGEPLRLALALMVFAVSWDKPNQTGWWTYLVLWSMRLSAKLNLFLGVRNLSENFLPAHLAYLQSYFTRRSWNWLMPVSVTAATAVLVPLWMAVLVLTAMSISAEELLFLIPLKVPVCQLAVLKLLAVQAL